jgi:NADH-quinone oxidoreductase subunit K
MMTPLTQQTLMVGALLFAFGLIGFLSRRNLILIFLSIELMLAGVATNFIAFGAHYGIASGQFFAILILTVASCEAAIALALVVALYRRKSTLDVELWSELRETDPDKAKPISDSEEEVETDYPVLTPAGVDPLTTKVPATLTDITVTKA